ncbi:hypothetical protein ACFX2I_003413 [Malus domestica]
MQRSRLLTYASRQDHSTRTQDRNISNEATIAYGSRAIFSSFLSFRYCSYRVCRVDLVELSARGRCEDQCRVEELVSPWGRGQLRQHD